MKKLYFLFSLIIFTCFNLHGQTLKGGGEKYPDLHTNERALQKWQALRFGMFVHWGPVSLKGTEIGWSRGADVPFEEYDNLYKKFDPENFNAAEWIGLMKDAGMKYLIIVSKHHDGFVMWDTKTTDYNIMSTPYGRDILMDLSMECKKQGILFGTYYSICDWKHPDYPVEENNPERRENANMENYIQYMKTQLKELVDTYHTKILWFDGEWQNPWTHEMGMDLYKYVRGLDDEIIINNRVDKGRQGMEGVSLSDNFAGDFATPEQQVGRFDPLTPWESCITICRQWSWKPNDKMKSEEECLQTLVRTLGGDGNLLFNVGPMPDGKIEDRQADRLREMGAWLNDYGAAIYETRGGPIQPQDWGVSTSRGKNIYLHVLKPVKEIILPDLSGEIVGIRSMMDDTEVGFVSNGTEVRIKLPKIEKNVIDYVLELSMK